MGLETDVLTPAMVGGALVYLTGEDQLRVTVFDSTTAARVEITGRFLTVAGRIQPFQFGFLPATDRTASTMTRALGEGWLLEASVRATAGQVLSGQCYVVLSIARGSTGAFTDLSTLAAGYVTQQQRVSWPGSGVRGPLEGAPGIFKTTGTNPAPNNEVLETVPTGARWRLRGVVLTLTTDANVANRTVQLMIQVGVNAPLLVPAVVVQVASQAITYYAAAVGAPGLTNLTNTQIILPADLVLAAGSIIATITVNRQVGDDYASPIMWVEEWMEP